MQTKVEVAQVFDTILSVPGMGEKVKVSLQTSRKNLLLLNKVIERGLKGKEADEKSFSLLSGLPPETLQELALIAEELLEKAGLVEMNEKLKAF
ncbi:MAG: hypothetical protein J0I32_09195 [Sphingobacteriales bacterium]|nr:hypothetical protein [Sphingobacteriales bacterium]OJW00174.1 MAG: hypothetical protein BGO52_03545 [Sphingobacteriales bacterium 44-61]